MLRVFLLCCIAALLSAAMTPAALADPPLVRTDRLVWPMPTDLQTTPEDGTQVHLDPAEFEFQLQGDAARSSVLQAAIQRYTEIIFSSGGRSRVSMPGTSATLSALTIRIEQLDAPLELGVDETYLLELEAGKPGSLHAATEWGALHGLELFSQIIQSRSGVYTIVDLPFRAKSAPRFAHRGVMIDSARHYLPKSAILRTIDALAYNHLNVLHWHIVDAESFPLVSPSAPELVKGAWTPESIYTPEDVEDIVQYAHARGVRVLMEVDVPGHAYSWGKGYPDVITRCPKYEHNINNIPLNPAVDQTWEVLENLLEDLLGDMLKDKYYHIGADEVVYGCWRESPILMEWANKKGFTDMVQVMRYFQERLWDMIEAYGVSIVAWEEVFTDYGLTSFPEDLVVHVWKDKSTLLKAASAKQPTILSQGWYLDHLKTWQDFYSNEPFAGNGWNSENKKYVLGGEAAAWAERVNEHNLDSTLWPKSSATAERLWSPAKFDDPKEAVERLNHQVCRMNRRGVGSGPVNPNHCYF